VLDGCASSDDEKSPFGFDSAGGTASGGTASVAGSSVGGTFFSGTGSTSGASFTPGGATSAPGVAGGGSGGSGGSAGSTAGTSTGGAPETAGASSGGTAAEAGSGGSGGSAPFVCGKAEGAAPLIDDFEDSNAFVAAVDGRSGVWENFDDSSLTGSYFPRSPTAAKGRNAGTGYCVAVSGYKEWGANLVANMSGTKCGYDASVYKGVCFWAKGSVAGGGPIVFAVGTDDTVPVASGGKCSANCNAHYQLKLTGESALTAEYKEYCAEWSELALPTISEPKPLDSKAIVQMEWKFPAGASVSTDGELCIDDVRFMQ